MTDSTGTTDFILDGQSVVREKKNGTYTATYLTGPRGIEYKKNDSTGAVSWYLYDGLGSVIAEVDNTGTITATNQNDVYGIILSSSGTGTTDHKFVGKLGHRTEAATGNLTYMGARYYDPTLGRFISEDPMSRGTNWYAYCSNNPTNRLDANGKEDFAITSIGDLVAAQFIGLMAVGVGTLALMVDPTNCIAASFGTYQITAGIVFIWWSARVANVGETFWGSFMSQAGGSGLGIIAGALMTIKSTAKLGSKIGVGAFATAAGMSVGNVAGYLIDALNPE